LAKEKGQKRKKGKRERSLREARRLEPFSCRPRCPGKWPLWFTKERLFGKGASIKKEGKKGTGFPTRTSRGGTRAKKKKGRRHRLGPSWVTGGEE